MRYTLMLLALLCFFSCQKTERIEEKKPTETEDLIKKENEELRNDAILTNTLSKDIFLHLMRASFSHPEIFGLQGDASAETRTCPTVTSSGNTFPITLVLDFGPAPGCTPPFFTLPKIGQITTTFFRPCFTDGPGPNFTISLSDDYQEQGYTILGGSGNGVNFDFMYVPTETSYKILFDDDIVFTNVNNGNTITVDARPDILDPFGEIGFIPDSGEIPDDPSNPFSYADNIYYLNISNSHIVCTNASNSSEFCLDITSANGNGLEFQPWECHCITSGIITINQDSDCSTGNNSGNADITYDFGNGDCDGDVDVTINGTTTTEHLLPCN